MEKKENLCQVCNQRHALYQIFTKSTSRFICMQCLRENINKGELKLKGQERIDFLNNLSLSIHQGSPHGSELPMPRQQKQEEEDEYLFTLQFGFDLTKKARNNEIDPIIGREKEIESAVRILERRTKNNPLLVGEPGVGKTAIIEGIAQRIAQGKVGDNLKNKRVISLSVAELLAGTKYRGEFEDRMKNIVNEVKEKKNIILFIDEFHQITSGGGGDSLDAGQILKPALSRGEIQMIGATTLDEYRVYIEKDKALARRFLKVTVNEPTPEESIEIIKGIRPKYEEYHKMVIPDEVIEESVSLSVKYISDRFLPDKAIDLIDEACAQKQLMRSSSKQKLVAAQGKIESLSSNKEQILNSGDFLTAIEVVEKENKMRQNLRKKQRGQKSENTISKEDLAFILNKWTGIPIQNLSKKDIERLKTIEKDLKTRVKGQDEAIKVLANAIKRSHVGLKDAGRPAGVFMMLGPTGVGKTELTKALTELLLGSEENYIRIDMSEYMEKHSVSKLIGSPPGYVGYEDEGELTKKLREKPYSVVLFDEVEKAHPDVLNILLQLFDEGRISNAKGMTVDGKNSIFIMTSNVGSDLYGSNKRRSLGYSTEEQNEEASLKSQIIGRLKQSYRPEFLNRIDDFLVFNRLSEEIMTDIAENMVKKVVTQLAEKEINLKFTKSAIEKLAKDGFNPELGARPLRRKIDDVKTLIADKIVEEGFVENLSVGVKNNQFYVKTN